jgi:hypothetical protein
MTVEEHNFRVCEKILVHEDLYQGTALEPAEKVGCFVIPRAFLPEESLLCQVSIGREDLSGHGFSAVPKSAINLGP